MIHLRQTKNQNPEAINISDSHQCVLTTAPTEEDEHMTPAGKLIHSTTPGSFYINIIQCHCQRV